jgi:hypothetical protein
MDITNGDNSRIANYYINPEPWGWAFWYNFVNDLWARVYL